MNNRKLKKILRQNAVGGDMTRQSRTSNTVLRRLTQVAACLLVVCLIGVGYVTLVRFVGRPDDGGNGPGTNPSHGGLSEDPADTSGDAAPGSESTTDSQTAPSTTSDYKPSGTDLRVTVINILAIDTGYVRELGGDDITGESLNDSLYMRRENVTQALGCAIRISYAESKTAFVNEVKNRVMASDIENMLAAAHSDSIMALTTINALTELNKTTGVDVKSEAWNPEMVETLSIKGNLYFVTGHISPNATLSQKFLVGNKGLMEAAGLSYSDTIKLVNEAKWTLEAVLALSKNATGTVLGLNGEHDAALLANGAGIRLADNNTLSLSSDWSGSITKLCALLSGVDTGVISTKNATLDNSMFSLCDMGTVMATLDSTYDYLHILPLPTLEETGDYRAPIGAAAFFYAIPRQYGADTVSTVLQSMAEDDTIEKQFLPVIKGRHVTLVGAVGMFDIVIGNTAFSLDPMLGLCDNPMFTNIIGSGEGADALIEQSRRLTETRLRKIAVNFAAR